MNFKDNDPIYIQIADYIIENILLTTWLPDTKIPSVRDLAMELEVNPNTVMRSYEYLQNQNIIYNKRGIGFFVEVNAVTNIKRDKRESFLKELPVLFKKMALLDISFGELQEEYQKFKPN